MTRMIGPITRPISPKAAAPPSNPKKTTRPLNDVLPLSSSGRSQLSTPLIPNAPMSSISTPRAVAPDSSNAIPVGTQTIVAPTTGSSEQNAVTRPQNAGAPSPSSQN